MKIISGGQTGADQGGLEGAKSIGLETGGTAPQGYRTENGPNLELKTLYGLTESASRGYIPRTIQNVLDADATVVFADDINSSGTVLTITMCKKYNKPCLINPSTDEVLIKFCLDNYVKTLNISGNRE